MKKFFKKYRLMKITGILVIFIILSYFTISSSWFITSVILPSVSRSMNIKLSADSCNFSLLYSSIKLQNVYFSDEKNFSVRFEKMEIKSSLRKLLNKQIDFDEVLLENSEIVIQKYDNYQQKIKDQKAFKNILKSEEKRFNKISGMTEEKAKKRKNYAQIKEQLQNDGKKTVDFIAQNIAESLKDVNIGKLQFKNVNLKVKFINEQNTLTEIVMSEFFLEVNNFALGKNIEMQNSFVFSMFADKVVNINQAKVATVVQCLIDKNGKVKNFNLESSTDQILGRVKNVDLQDNVFDLKVAGEGINDVFNLKKLNIAQYDKNKKLVSLVTSEASTAFQPFLGKFNIKVARISQELMTIVGFIVGNELIGDCNPKFEGNIEYSQSKIVADGELDIKFRKSREYPFIDSIVQQKDSILRILNYHAKNITKVDASLKYQIKIIPKIDDVQINKIDINVKNNLAEKFSLTISEPIKFSLPKLIHKIKISRHYLNPLTQGAVEIKAFNFRLDKLFNEIIDKKDFSMRKGYLFTRVLLSLSNDKKLQFNTNSYIKNLGFKIKKDNFVNANYKLFAQGKITNNDIINLKILDFSVDESKQRQGIAKIFLRDCDYHIKNNYLSVKNSDILIYDKVVEYLPNRYLKNKLTVDLTGINLNINSGIVLDLKNNYILLRDLNLDGYESGLKNKMFSIKNSNDLFRIDFSKKNDGSMLSYPIKVEYLISPVKCASLFERLAVDKKSSIENGKISSNGEILLSKKDIKLDADINFEDKVNKLNLWNKSNINFKFDSKNLNIYKANFNINNLIKLNVVGGFNFVKKGANLQLDLVQVSDKIFSIIRKDELAKDFKFDGTGKSSVTLDFKKEKSLHAQTLLQLKNINKNKDLSAKIICDFNAQNDFSFLKMNNCDIMMFKKTKNIADISLKADYYLDYSQRSLINIKGNNLVLTDIFDDLKMNSKISVKKKNNERITVDKLKLENSKPVVDYLPEKEPIAVDFNGMNLHLFASLDNVKYREIDGNIKVQGKIENNVVFVDDLSVSLAGGGILVADGAIDLGISDGYVYSFNADIDDLPLTNIMNSILPTKEKYSHGVLNSLQFEAVGKGISRQNVKKNLKMSLKANGKDFFIPNDYAKIRAYRLIFIPLEMLGRIESAIPKIVSFNKILQGFKDISQSAENVNGFHFYSGDIDSNYEQGRLFLNNFSMKGYLVREIKLVGLMDMYDNERLDLRALLNLPFFEMPFEIKGYLLKPKTIYTKTLQGIIKNNTLKFFDKLKNHGSDTEDGSNIIFDFFKDQIKKK
ncbi:hypothetical protein AAEX28_10710 [Lentisphaerota bacterium WC36G]|nr:hypothetical protein LJT99_13555 [Lentisphaerae bacterium WC36]